MRALGYSWTPTSDSARSQAFADAFDAYCAARGHIAAGAFHDAGNGESPGYQQMLKRIAGSGVGYLVVVPAVSHLGRTLREQVVRILELDELSCQVICDDSDAPDPLQAAVAAAQDGAISHRRRERIVEGMKAKAALGLGVGKPPYGYGILYDGAFRTIEKEAEVVRSIFRMYVDEGLGIRSIAQRLNEARIRTRRGNRWSMVTVRDILRNSAYIGTYRRFGLRIPGSYQPIVSAGDFRAAQDRMANRSPGKRRVGGEPFLLSGLLNCGFCGQRMMGVVRRQMWRRRDGERMRGEYRYYQCQSRINQSRCDYRTTRAYEVEDSVLREVRMRPVDRAIEPGDPSEGPSRLKARLGTLDRRFVESVRVAATGAMTIRQLRHAIADLDADREQIEGQLASASSNGHSAVDDARSKLDLDVWHALQPEEQQAVLRTLVARVTLKNGAIEVVHRA